jgi:glycosyltransferase involved in cell wall biosynthesis
MPSVLEVNAPLPDEQARHRVLHDRAAAEDAAREAIGAASVVIAVSKPVAEWAVAIGGTPEATGTKFHVVANGVDVERFQPTDRPLVDGVTCTIGFVGTLKSWHGIDTLAEAFALLATADPCYRLLIVGDGPEWAALEAKMAADGLTERVELVGAVDPAAVPSLLQRIDIAVAPYPASSGYFSPLKLYEYLAAALPVVASNVGQIADVIDDGRTGLLCRPGAPGELAAAIRVLRADPARAASLGRAGRTMVEQHHTWQAVVDRILTLARRTEHRLVT